MTNWESTWQWLTRLATGWFIISLVRGMIFIYVMVSSRRVSNKKVLMTTHKP
jgi:hypothetical protein